MSEVAAIREQAAVRERTYTWFDPRFSAARSREMDGMAFLEAIRTGELPPPPVMSTLGIEVVEGEPGRIVFALDPAEYHYNPIGMVHGGVLATILDSAAGCAVHSLLPAGAYYSSLDLTTKFLRPVTLESGRLHCEGSVTSMGSRTALAQARLEDARGRLVGFATSTCMVFRPDLGVDSS
jgi:uncharacterized protein (TIGR00369 family)